MFKSQKILLAILITLFIIVGTELFYLFYYQLFLSQKNQEPIKIIPTEEIKSTDIAGVPSSSKIESSQKIKDLIKKAELEGRNFNSYLSILNGLDQKEECISNQVKCFQLHNQLTEWWLAKSDKDFPIKISGPFIVRLNFYGSKEPSGVSFDGKLSNNIYEWWSGLITVFFGVGEDGKRLYIDAKNNNKEPFVLYDKTFEKKIEGIYILFDEEGKNFLVTDLWFNEIASIDVNKITDNKFPQGLFPDKQFYIGYAVAPMSDLIVYDLSIL